MDGVTHTYWIVTQQLYSFLFDISVFNPLKHNTANYHTDEYLDKATQYC